MPNGNFRWWEVGGGSGVILGPTANPNHWWNGAGGLPATYGGQPFDVDQDGWLGTGEVVTFGMNVVGNTGEVVLNGISQGTFPLVATSGAGATNLIGLTYGSIDASGMIADGVWDNIDILEIPEPSTLVLLVIGLMGLAYGYRKR